MRGPKWTQKSLNTSKNVKGSVKWIISLIVTSIHGINMIWKRSISTSETWSSSDIRTENILQQISSHEVYGEYLAWFSSQVYIFVSHLKACRWKQKNFLLYLFFFFLHGNEVLYLNQMEKQIMRNAIKMCIYRYTNLLYYKHLSLI